MKEEEWWIDLPDGARLYGVTHYAGSRPSDRAVIIVNGLGCFYFFHPYFSATGAFLEKGYDVIGFNFCEAREKARNILDCSLPVFVEDFRTLLAEKTRGYGKVFLAGHSYGGPIILTANPPNIAAVSLWDPSYNMADHSWASGLTETLPGDRLLIRWGGAYVSARAMWDAESRYDMDFCRSLSAQAAFPVQVLHAGGGFLYRYGESWHSHCPHPTDYCLIENAGHYFEQRAAFSLLAERCLRWFGQF